MYKNIDRLVHSKLFYLKPVFFVKKNTPQPYHHHIKQKGGVNTYRDEVTNYNETVTLQTKAKPRKFVQYKLNNTTNNRDMKSHQLARREATQKVIEKFTFEVD